MTLFKTVIFLVFGLLLTTVSAVGEAKGIESANKFWVTRGGLSGLVETLGLFAFAAGGVYLASLFFYRKLGVNLEAIQFLIWLSVVSLIFAFKNNLFNSAINIALYAIAIVCLGILQLRA